MREESCINCRYIGNGEDEFPCSCCVHNFISQYQAKTNYDRIKEFSIEQMADFLYQISTDSTAPEKVIELYHKTRMTQKECFEEWLLQEVSENE